METAPCLKTRRYRSTLFSCQRLYFPAIALSARTFLGGGFWWSGLGLGGGAGGGGGSLVDWHFVWYLGWLANARRDPA